ncbi:MAG: hypothetical protein KGJ78_07200 [Alphaproteobacteria bacterium]|nr:hypothetical protein [Alphaproteobacteria bacterium]
MQYPHDNGGSAKAPQHARVIAATMIFAVMCLLGSFVSQARADSFTPEQLQPFERTYYDQLLKKSGTDAANFLATRAYVRQAQDVVDHPDHGLDFPHSPPKGYSVAYLIKGEDFLIAEAVGQALYMRMAGLTAATLPPHPLLQTSMTNDEWNKYDALNKDGKPKLAEAYSDTRAYINQCGQVVHYPDRAANLPSQPADYTPRFVSKEDAQLVRAAVQLHQQALHGAP